MNLPLKDNCVLYEDDAHQVIWFGWEEHAESNFFVQTNQCLIINGGRGYLFDPGGTYVFGQVLEQVAKYLNPQQLHYLIATHQDPDVCSSAPLWMQTTDARLLISRLWLHFVSHFGLEQPDRVVSVPDQGMALDLPSGDRLHLIPAHFLHSEGNFSIYDERSRILFSGDIGASIFPEQERIIEVKDFSSHRKYMEPFHKRYMHSNAVCQRWVRQIQELPHGVSRIVPQHGAMLPAEHVASFLDWLHQLRCGSDYLEAIYTGQRF